jgi:hypothetical protein
MATRKEFDAALKLYPALIKRLSKSKSGTVHSDIIKQWILIVASQDSWKDSWQVQPGGP